ncbi:hypothetical protein HUN08_01330 [Gordonia sp. X0973]|uniref:hypothetical protein n=1 Tax=Gordonia sp. X0973 TaxID=2742602 RepID=UPI000F53D492|nr:hypothetical protein [Gordonia sp. X0973]QKT05982.1 hypothetical protein HUN08_01330 [Gordonia sp. X0973]
MNKAASVLTLAAAAATSVALAAAPASAAPGDPQGRVSFGVDGHSLVATATNLPGGLKTCDLYRGVRNRGPSTGSLGGGNLPAGERTTSQRSVQVKSRPLPAGNYHVSFICTAGSRIVADRDGWVRVTVRPQVGPTAPRPGTMPPGPVNNGPRGH